ncbi:outer membrane protein assembly factor BamB [Caldichromatium japonicum]|uniref:Outer membrane protein assembly factor BamB n=1 Tax=Caldichromatium japonicum TaxID=2699430 RepID=A0A6G7VBI3_9GAMM|nr:outer membrane protein assembly factor BamB [Caldichromatium japonicum]QIK37419.1 outer membrane protein assembly factor BamB [Caldichromatium japonicum]
MAKIGWQLEVILPRPGEWSVIGRLGPPLVFALWLSGCGMIPWLAPERDPHPPSPLPPLAQEQGLVVSWSAQPTRGTEGRQLRLVPALAAGRLYVADAPGRVVALDAGSGRELWRRETGLKISAGPEVAGERLLVGTSQGEVVALSLQDGQELWRTSVGAEILAVPRYRPDPSAGGRVIVHTLDDSIYSLDAATGQIQWRVNYPPPVLTLRGSSTPLLTEDGIVIGLAGGKLVKLSPSDGLPLWEVVITRPGGRTELARITDIDADPIWVGETIYIGAYNGDLAGVQDKRGEVLWRRKLSVHAGLAADAEGIYITDSEDQVWAADPRDGAGRWKQDQLHYRRLTAPAILGNNLLVGDLEGYVHLLAKRDGALIGRARLAKSRISARPLVAEGRVYIYGEDGTLCALQQP